ALFAACGAKPDAKAATGRDSIANGEVAKTPAAPTVTHHGAETFLKVDSVRPHLVPGRNAHDSVSYFSAIRAGTRAVPHWPAWPTPLAGSLLPDHRIVAFYGNLFFNNTGTTEIYTLSLHDALPISGWPC